MVFNVETCQKSDDRIQNSLGDDGYMDSLANRQAKLNYEHLCDLEILLELVCILPLLEFVYVFMKICPNAKCICV